MASPFRLRRKARFDDKATRLMVRAPAPVARKICGRSRSLSVQGVSVPRPGRVRPGARTGPWDGGGRRSARRRIALRIGSRGRERENEGNADRGKDCGAHGHFPNFYAGCAPKLATPLYASRPALLTLELGHPHLHRARCSIGPQVIGQSDKRGVAGRGRLSRVERVGLLAGNEPLRARFQNHGGPRTGPSSMRRRAALSVAAPESAPVRRDCRPPRCNRSTGHA